jgi:ABC-type uncharacterized transport system permease subunit
MTITSLLTPTVIIALLAAGVRLATPILLASLGELLSERAGVMNLGLEGVMLIGTLAGFVGSQLTHSPWVGALAGFVLGGAAGLVVAFLCISLYANQAIVGVVFNILGAGLTGFLFRVVYGIRTTSAPPKAAGFQPAALPLLKDIPWLGEILFNQTPLVYLALVLVLIEAIVLFRTRFGLNVRAVGGYAKAADTMGINVYRVRYAAVILGGALAGLGGAFLSLEMGIFRDSMTQGRGFIAIAIVTFAQWNPWGALAGSLLFGVADSLQLHLQAFGFKIPYQFLLMLPYVLTVIVLIISSRQARPPSILGVPYIRDRKS